MSAKRLKPNTSVSVTCTAPVNIAVIKYWGKRHEELILPINSSLSGTLDQNDMHAMTTATAGPEIAGDVLILNGEVMDMSDPRRQGCLGTIRKLAYELYKKKHGTSHPLEGVHVEMVSKNNFPTAAGLASSAAGYACLVFTLAKLYGIPDDHNVSSIARLGSGSACRSMFGGFVSWEMGSLASGEDSVALQVADEHHWEDMEVLILVVDHGKKSISSTSGMKTTVDTSPLIKYRADVVVPQRMKEMKEAILHKDFHKFAELTMKDSNEFHAVCLDTYPPIMYLNNTSRAVINILTKFNHLCGVKAAYTFDAGPNAVIYALKKDIPTILSIANTYFPRTQPVKDGGQFIRGRSTSAPTPSLVPESLAQELSGFEPMKDSLEYIIHTSIGPGPKVVDVSAELKELYA
eukprot:m.121399 g.121399  ORF g.121399 m.121399 type:complete len:405 (-) comp16203_c0_seq1:1616-2830(-)